MISNRTKVLAHVVIGAALALMQLNPRSAVAQTLAPAQTAVSAAAAVPQAAVAKEVVRVCTTCHNETWRVPVLQILKSKHAVMGDTRTPFGDKGCMTCHGTSEKHLRGEGPPDVVFAPETFVPEGPPDVVFKGKAATPATQRNAKCLACHESGLRMHFKGSTHEAQGLACVSCHQIHTDRDPVLGKTTQPDVCFQCHKDRRADIHKLSSHPIKDGKLTCSNCHNPHGSSGSKLLVKGTINETCFSCHAEKRGPFLYEHVPVREDCSNCHNPHGSVNEALLKQRAPWLCQQCHIASNHPSTPYSGSSLPSAATPSGAVQMLGRGCRNCHSQIHGSNHPSGRRFQR